MSAHGTDMNVRPRRLAAHGAGKREVRNVTDREKVPQPHALGLVRVYSHIHAGAMIEAERAVYRGFAIGAHRQALRKLALIGAGDLREVTWCETAIAVEALGERMHFRRRA